MRSRKRERINQCINFMSENIDFFTAIVSNSQAIKSLNAKDNVSHLIDSMRAAFEKDTSVTLWLSVSEFRRAICGQADSGETGLIDGDKSSIAAFLAHNPAMVDAILSNQNDPILEEWKQHNDYRLAQLSRQRDSRQRPNTIMKASHKNSDGYGLMTYGLFAIGALALTAGVAAGVSYVLKKG